MNTKKCKNCGKEFPQFNTTQNLCNDCFYKKHSARRRMPQKRIRKESQKSYISRKETEAAWLLANPPDINGEWICYLNISPRCPMRLTAETLVHEHVKSKIRHPELKYDITNIMAACEFCNAIKGSLDLEDLVGEYPHLKRYM